MHNISAASPTIAFGTVSCILSHPDYAPCHTQELDRLSKDLASKLQKATAENSAFREQRDSTQAAVRDAEAKLQQAVADRAAAAEELLGASSENSRLKESLERLREREADLAAKNGVASRTLAELEAWKQDAENRLAEATAALGE